MCYRIVLCFFLIFSVSECKYGYAVLKDEQVEVTETVYYADIPDVHIARATFTNEINSTGSSPRVMTRVSELDNNFGVQRWAFLELHTSDSYSDEKQAYAAGYLEGFLTRDLVWMHWQNMLKGYCYNKTDICGLIEEFIDKNEKFMSEMVISYHNDPYWYHVNLYYIQIEGLAAGYNKATEDPYEWLTTRDIVWINMLGDLDELAFALSMPNGTDNQLFSDHCTGLVKLLPDWSNLYFAQSTWNSYQSMLRLQKMYVLRLHLRPHHSDLIPGFKMALSSYPAFIQSTDDFYILSSGLTSAETTIGNSNRSLYESINPKGVLLEYARAMVANRLATTGKEWVEIFIKYNSGTYNNQWYIVDYKQFKPRTSIVQGEIKPGLLWVVEQLPTYTESSDLTELLKQSTYFPSYNIPFFPRIFNLSGGNVRIETYGDWFGYETNPRAHMLKEKQANIKSLRDMYRVMRYNDFKYDPLSRCEECKPPYSACNAIAARNDLNPANGTYPFRALGHRSHGATDVKITSAYLRASYRFLAVSCPTYNISRGIPPFQWSRFDLGKTVTHIGHPDLWLFHPVLHDWEWE